MMRTKEADYKEANLGDASVTDEDLFSNGGKPKTVWTPCCCCEQQSKIGRPPEQVLEILQANMANTFLFSTTVATATHKRQQDRLHEGLNLSRTAKPCWERWRVHGRRAAWFALSTDRSYCDLARALFFAMA